MYNGAMRLVAKALVSFLSLSIFSFPIANANQTISVISSQPTIGSVDTVPNIWKGDVPVEVGYPSGTYSQKLEFAIQGLLPYSTLADRATGVEVEFEIWSQSGKKIASDTVYSFDWNPVGPNTMVSMYLSEGDAIGTHTLLIRTIYELSTTGLLTRYLKSEIKRPISVVKRKKSQTITFKAPGTISTDQKSITIYSSDLYSSELSLRPDLSSKTPTICSVSSYTVNILTAGTCTLVASHSGNDTVMAANDVSVSFQINAGKPSTPSLSGVRSSSSVTYTVGSLDSSFRSIEVGISPIISPNLSPTSLMSFYATDLLKSVDSSTFTLTKEEVEAYLGRVSLGYQKHEGVVLVKVRVRNDSGVSDWSGGIYTTAQNFGIVAQSVNPKSEVTIVCVKGKQVRKVTAQNPKCPRGFKKK